MRTCRKTIKPLLELASLESRGSGMAEGLALGLVTGIMIGGLAGVLFAPAKGSKTRRRTKNKILQAKNRVEEGIVDAAGSVGDMVGNVEEHVEEGFNKMGNAGTAVKREFTR